MTTKIRMTLLTAFFFFGLLTGLQAQEKLENAIVTYHRDLHILSTSLNGQEYEEITVNKKDLKGTWDLNPLVTKVTQLTDKGWEIFSTSNGNDVFVYYLRKKKN